MKSMIFHVFKQIKDNIFRFSIILSFMVFLPALLHADGVSPLVMLGIVHLVIGNFFIGILEGFIISKMFKTHMLKSMGIMILANYISAICGYLGIAGIVNAFGHIATAGNQVFLIIGIFLLTFVFTIAIEWPFCFWIIKVNDKRWSQALRASVIVNTASYALLVPAYIIFGRM